MRLHAAVHAIVENQLALGEAVVVETLARLQDEGLSRHDALHAIGSVLAGYLDTLMRDRPSVDKVEGHKEYFLALKVLTAESWRKSGELGSENYFIDRTRIKL